MDVEVVTRLRAVDSEVDPYSQTSVPSWTDPAELDITTLAPAEPRTSTEPVDVRRDRVDSGWTLYLPYGTDVDPQDRFRVRGLEYDVDGTPGDWLGAGIVVQLNRTEG